MKLFIFAFCTILYITPSIAQQIRQCGCSEIQGCKSEYVNSVIPCADACKGFVDQIGASYPALRRCLVAREPQLMATMKCVEASHSNACSRGGGGMVPKRYPETLKIAAMSEISSLLKKNGISGQVQGLFTQGKRLFGCMRKCVDKKAGHCANKLKCGLALPSDSVMVQTAKRCAIQSGFNAHEMQQICQCALNAGVKQLAGVCGKIRTVN